MKAVVFHDIGDIRLEDIPVPTIQEPTDAILKITASAICGTDLHMIRGTLPGMQNGTVLGHEAVGIVEEVGENVRNLSIGDRVVIPSSIACGYCTYCRNGLFAKCIVANPNGTLGATAFFGGPKEAGSFQGLQAEKARIPFANVGPVKLPDEITDEEAIFLSDILPTAYFGADIAGVKPGNIVAVFGCGPVGQLVIASLKTMQAGRIIAIDMVESRLDMAKIQGAEVINFNHDDPIEVMLDITGGLGVDIAIDAVGVDAVYPEKGPAAQKLNGKRKEFSEEVKKIAPKTHPVENNWVPGDGPSQVLEWAVESLSPVGILSIIGEYPSSMEFFPIGKVMHKNLSLRSGSCHHRKYIPKLLDMVIAGELDPAGILTQREPLDNVIDAYKAFDKREPNWIKVELTPYEMPPTF